MHAPTKNAAHREMICFMPGPPTRIGTVACDVESELFYPRSQTFASLLLTTCRSGSLWCGANSPRPSLQASRFECFPSSLELRLPPNLSVLDSISPALTQC